MSKIIKAKILKHKTLEGFTGTIKSSTLFRVGSGLVPQLFEHTTTIVELDKIIKYTDSFANSLNDFELVDVEVKILK